MVNIKENLTNKEYNQLVEGLKVLNKIVQIVEQDEGKHPRKLTKKQSIRKYEKLISNG